jgi:hypothetical protein
VAFLGTGQVCGNGHHLLRKAVNQQSEHLWFSPTDDEVCATLGQCFG